MKKTMPPSTYELKNKDKLLHFLYSPKFKKVENQFESIALELKELSKNDGSPLEDRLNRLSSKMVEARVFLAHQLRLNRLPVHFVKSLFDYLVKDKMVSPVVRNFTILPKPVIRILRDGQIKNYADEIILTTYAPLSTEEMGLAFKLLKSYWKRFFSPEIIKRTNLRNRDIDRQFKIEQEMIGRRLKNEYGEDSYFSSIKKQYGEKTYKQSKKNRPELIFLKKSKKTAKDISKQFYGTKNKAGALRTKYSRTKKRFSSWQ